MKRRTRKKTLLSLLLAAVLVLSGCGGAEELTKGITPNEVSVSLDQKEGDAAFTDFALRLLRAGAEPGENALLSPLSVLSALAMTASGAEEETLREMETVLGMTAEELKSYFHTYMNTLPQDEGCELYLANSVWFTDDEGFRVNEDFLQTGVDHFGAEIFRAPFTDKTCKEINAWVKKNTGGMIGEILQQLPPDAVMCLVNALAFEAEWARPYENEWQVREGVFTREDGTEQTAEFMCGSEGAYLDDGLATGFLKYYEGYGYAFAALLPNEGVSVQEYLASLDGEALRTMLANPQDEIVDTALPKFEVTYGAELSDVLRDMGMEEAFDPERADFGGLGTSENGGLYLSQVIHKTFISVTEKGTKAGAATAVIVGDGAAPGEPKVVTLDRPFVYLLVDAESGTPFFIGTMMDPAQ